MAMYVEFLAFVVENKSSTRYQKAMLEAAGRRPLLLYRRDQWDREPLLPLLPLLYYEQGLFWELQGEGGHLVKTYLEKYASSWQDVKLDFIL